MGKQNDYSDSEDNLDDEFLPEIDDIETSEDSLPEPVNKNKDDQDKRAADARRKIERIREERELRAQLDDIYFSDED